MHKSVTRYNTAKRRRIQLKANHKRFGADACRVLGYVGQTKGCAMDRAKADCNRASGPDIQQLFHLVLTRLISLGAGSQSRAARCIPQLVAGHAQNLTGGYPSPHPLLTTGTVHLPRAPHDQTHVHQSLRREQASQHLSWFGSPKACSWTASRLDGRGSISCGGDGVRFLDHASRLQT